MVNTATILGRLVRNADFNKFDNNSVARFTLAVDKGLSKEKKEEMEALGKPTADFIPCQAWGKTAEFINNYTEKGSRIAVVGRIQTGSYEKDGERRYTTEVVAQSVEVIDWKSKEDNYQSDFKESKDTRIPF